MAHQAVIVNLEGAIFRGNQYLMAMRSLEEDHAGGTLGFVSGTSELEDQQATDVMTAWLQREISEEVGVEVGELYYATSNFFQTDTSLTVLNIVFLCPYVSGEARAVDPKEVAWIQWMTAEDALEHEAVQPWTRNYLHACEQVRQQLNL